MASLDTVRLAKLATALADSKTALAAKGVSVPAGALLDDIPDLIAQVPSGGGADSQADAVLVLSDYDSDGFPHTATFKGNSFNGQNAATGKLGAYGASTFLSKITKVVCDPTISSLSNYGLNGLSANIEELSCYDALTALPANGGITIYTVAQYGYFPPQVQTIEKIGRAVGISLNNFSSSIHIPASVVSISGDITCTNFPATVIFDGTPSAIAASAFTNARNVIQSIKVPWSEGSVANAPWGASNATITYDYTGEE